MGKRVHRGRRWIRADQYRSWREFANSITPGYTADLLLESPPALFGSVDGIIQEIEARRERWGFSYITVIDEVLETFAPVVERLNGK